MKDRGHCTSGMCPETSEKGEVVQLYVDYNHPLLQLKRGLPWDRLFEVMSRHWRAAGPEEVFMVQELKEGALAQTRGVGKYRSEFDHA